LDETDRKILEFLMDQDPDELEYALEAMPEPEYLYVSGLLEQHEEEVKQSFAVLKEVLESNVAPPGITLH